MTMMLCATLAPIRNPKMRICSSSYVSFSSGSANSTFFPIMQKIASKENNVADFISRVYAKDEIDKFFKSCGYNDQTPVNIPHEWFSFQAEW